MGLGGSTRKAFLLVLYHCGLRTDEASHLIWQDLSEACKELVIQPHVNLPGVFDWGPKGKARRTLPVPACVLAALAELPRATPYVFVPPARYRQLLAGRSPESRGLHTHCSLLLHSLPKGFRKLRELAGIREGTLHEFRRTFVTNWLQKLPPHEVQLLAGHEDIQTTLAIYAEVTGAQVVERARALQTA